MQLRTLAARQLTFPFNSVTNFMLWSNSVFIRNVFYSTAFLCLFLVAVHDVVAKQRHQRNTEPNIFGVAKMAKIGPSSIISGLLDT